LQQVSPVTISGAKEPSVLFI